jgi:hypothetical protein
MCRKAGKTVRSNFDDCLLELKVRPFVNILDFVDPFRTGDIIPTFSNWKKFVKYTSNDRKIDYMMAKENDFLVPLL